MGIGQRIAKAFWHNTATGSHKQVFFKELWLVSGDDFVCCVTRLLVSL